MGTRIFITLDSSADLTDLEKQIELLTDAAELVTTAIRIDESKREIVIPMKRKHVGRKRRFFSLRTQPFLSSKILDCQLIVRDYQSYTITNLADQNQIPSIHILFGVQIKDSEVYLCSAEEIHGPAAFEMRINLRSYNIEL